MYFFLKEKVLLCKRTHRMCVCVWEAARRHPSITVKHKHECSSLHSLRKQAKKSGDSIRRTRLSCSCQLETACRVSGGLKRAMLTVCVLFGQVPTCFGCSIRLGLVALIQTSGMGEELDAQWTLASLLWQCQRLICTTEEAEGGG